MHIKTLLGAAVVIAALGLGLVVATADKSSDRRNYINKIERLLKDASGYLDGIESDSSSSDIGYAIRKVDDTRSYLDKLKGVQESDSKAKEMTYRYPGYISKFKDAAKNLRKLKDKQRSVDKLAKHCDDATRKLERKLEQYVKPNDPKGLKEIPRYIKQIGKPIAEKLKKAERKKSELERYKSDAKRFSESTNNWSYVKDKLHRGADRIFGHWKKRYDQAKRSCQYFERWERHPLVEKAIKKLSRGSQDRDKIIRKLNDNVGKLAGYVRDVHRTKSSSKISSAQSIAREINNGLGRLKYAKGKHKRANEIVNKWPRYVSDLKSALSAFKRLKSYQYRLDKGPPKCKQVERKLLDMAKKFEGQKDPKNLDQLPKFAKQVGDKIRKGIKKGDNDKSQVERERSDTKRFSADDGKWRDVKSNLHNSANGILDYWKRALEGVHKSCDRVALGEKHPRVLAVMRKFKNQGGRGKAAKRKAMDAKRTAVDKCKQMSRAAKDRNQELKWHMSQAKKIKDKARGWPRLVTERKKRQGKLKGLQGKLHRHIKQCRNALKAYTAADAAWEKIYGR